MKEHQGFSREEYLTDDFGVIQNNLQVEIKNRQEDIFEAGISLHQDTSVAFSLVPSTYPGSKGIDVLTGAAYDVESRSFINTSTSDITEKILGRDRLEIVPLESVLYDSAANFVNSLNKQDLVPTPPLNTPVQSGNIAVPLANATLNVINYFYLVYFQVTDLNNLNTFLFTPTTVPVFKSKPDIEEKIVKYPYKRNGYGIFVTTIDRDTTQTGVASTASVFSDAGFTPNSGLIYGTQAFFLGKVAGAGVGVAIPTTSILTQGQFSLPIVDPTINTRKIFKQTPKSVRVTVPNPANPSDPNDAEKTQTYFPGTSVTLDDHARAIGSTLPSRSNPHGLTPLDLGLSDIDLPSHRREEHADGIVTTNYTSVLGGYSTTDQVQTSSLFCVVDTGNPNQVLIKSLLDGAVTTGLTGSTDILTPTTTEEAYINGSRLVEGNIALTSITAPNVTLPAPTAATVSAVRILKLFFNQGGNSPVGDYVVFLRQDGNLDAINIGTQSFPPVKIMKLAQFNIDTLGAGPIKTADLRVLGTTATFNVQDFVVTPNKINILQKIVNTGVFQPTTASTTSITLSGSQQFIYSMDGFYTKHAGGFVKQGLSGGVSSKVDGRSFSITNTDPAASAVFPALNTAGPSLDAGVLRASNWYGVFAVEDLTNVGKFKLRFVPFIRVQNITGNVITPAFHTTVVPTALSYTWTAGDYKGSQFMVLTGTTTGRIYDISNNATGTLTSTQAISGLVVNDWLMLSPAQVTGSTNMTGLNPNNYRYLGAVYSSPTGTISPFRRLGNNYSRTQAPVSGPITTPGTPIALPITHDSTGTNSPVPPTASAIRGDLTLIFAVLGPTSEVQVVTVAGDISEVGSAQIRHDRSAGYGPGPLTNLVLFYPKISLLGQTTTGGLYMSFRTNPAGLLGTPYITEWEE